MMDANIISAGTAVVPGLIQAGGLDPMTILVLALLLVIAAVVWVGSRANRPDAADPPAGEAAGKAAGEAEGRSPPVGTGR